MLNQCNFIGNLGKDPESKTFQNGGKIVNFSIAVSERWKDKNTGETKERTEWVNVVVQNEALQNVVEQYCRKGTRVMISGKMQTRKWQDQGGNDKYTTEIVLGPFNSQLILLTPRDQNGEQPQQSAPRSQPQSAPRSQQSNGGGKPAGGKMYDDEIPFAPEVRG